MKPIRILHCHSTFSLGGKEARAVRLMNVFGEAATHTILSAMPDQLGAREAIDSNVQVEFPGDAAPSLQGKPSPLRYRKLARYMAGFDLVLTYNWGSMDAVGAHWLFPPGLPPLIHHEDGFNADEAMQRNWKRNAFRRLVLPTAHRTVVVSRRLETIAREEWHRPDTQIVRIPNGIDVARYRLAPKAGAIPGFRAKKGDLVIGTLAGLREVKNLPRLVRAVAEQPDHVKLVIVGEGPERQTIEDEARRCGIAHRVHLPGFLPEPSGYVGLFDIFALSSDSEQFPISLVEAMAAGLPAVSTDVGDVRSIVADDNRPYIVSAHDEQAFANALRELVDQPNLRKSVGEANRSFAHMQYDEQAMIARYAALYSVPLPAVSSARRGGGRR